MLTTPSKSNIFANTVKISSAHTTQVLEIVNAHFNELGIFTAAVGSTYSPKKDQLSNDVDLQVELNDVIRAFGAAADPAIKNDTVEKANRRALRKYFEYFKFETAQSGINVFICVPYEGNRYQVDLEIIYNVQEVCEFHRHVIPDNSPYKGVHKQLLLVLLAKQNQYLYSAWEGLYKRVNNKKGQFVTNNWKEISMLLTGKEDSLECVEAILASLPHEQAAALLTQAKLDKNWIEL